MRGSAKLFENVNPTAFTSHTNAPHVSKRLSGVASCSVTSLQSKRIAVAVALRPLRAHSANGETKVWCRAGSAMGDAAHAIMKDGRGAAAAVELAAGVPIGEPDSEEGVEPFPMSMGDPAERRL